MASGSSFGQSTISIYLWCLFIFIVIKCIIDSNIQYSEITNISFLMLFSLSFFFYLLGTNITLTSNELVCNGKKNDQLGFYATIFPYIFVYVIGMVLVHIFPGWLRSFSNTFGLTIVRMCGYENTVKSIFKKDNAIKEIYDDPDIFINELRLDDENLLDTINEITKIQNISNKDIEQLKQFMNIKETIGTYIWVGIFSLITILISHNYMLSENCNSNIENEDKFQKYLATQLKD
jgi:hypothetical protein